MKTTLTITNNKELDSNDLKKWCKENNYKLNYPISIMKVGFLTPDDTIHEEYRISFDEILNDKKLLFFKLKWGT